jgi:TRAP-type C4-dicarboxylate transport system substrate-binding protein
LNKFRSLPPALQGAITRAADETRIHTQDYLIQTYGNFLNEARRRGMNVFELQKGSSSWKDWEQALDKYKRDISPSYSASLLRMIP